MPQKPTIRLKPNGYEWFYSPEKRRDSTNGMILVHRHIMEQIIGRPLTSREVVHHINGIRSDNRPENLMLMDRAEHTRVHRLGYRSVPACLECGSTSTPFFAKGLCKTCYNRRWKASVRICTCITCGEQRKHEAKGMCKRCYSAEWKRNHRTSK